MKRSTEISHAVIGAVLVTVGGGARTAQAQDSKALYSHMAPLEEYLMDRDAEIALARSAAPASISNEAAVWVVGRHGYDIAIRGTNGFVCLVERSWMSPFDFPEFWNAKMRGPLCFNAPAARSILPLTFKRTELVLAGLPKAQVVDSIKAFDQTALPPLEPGSRGQMEPRRPPMRADWSGSRKREWCGVRPCGGRR
jgi:hypothetical protein